MTLLVVLGFVVIATILVALYLSLKSARGGDREPMPDLGGASAGGRQARGGSRPGRPPSRAGRFRAMAGSGKAAGKPGRRATDDADDAREAPDYAAARRHARDGSGRPDRGGLVTAATRRGSAGAGAGGDPRRGAAAQFPDDDTDPAFRPGYGGGVQGYDGYDGATDTRVSGAVPGAGPYDTGPAPYRGYAGGASRAGASGGYERGRDTAARGDRSRGRGQGDGYTDYETDPAQGGYARNAGPGYNGGYNTGPAAQRPDPSPRGRYPEAPRGRYPDAAAGDVTVANHAYGRADPGPAAEQTALGTPQPDFGAAEPGFSGASLADGPFSPAPGSRSLPGPAGDGDDGDDGLPGRRRAGKLHKPRRRLTRGRPDEDDAPWPSADVDGVSDEQYWAELSSDKPLATTARTAQSGDDADQPQHPEGSAADQGPSGSFSAPVPADAPSAARGRRGRRRGDDGRDGAEVPRPDQEPEFGSAARQGHRRRGEPAQSPRNAEEDPLTSASFSRHAREASDSRSYRASRDPQRPSPGGRREPPAADTQSLMPTQAFRSPGPATRGPAPRGTRGAPAGSNLPPSGRPDPYGDGAYRNGTRPAGPYTERTGGYGRPGNGGGSRHAGGPDAARSPAPPDGQRRQRPALPGPAQPGAGPAAGGAGTGAGTNGWRDGGEAGYRAQPNGPGYTPGYSGTTPPYQERSRRGSGDYPAGRRPYGEESRRGPADAYDDPYGRTDNGRS